MLRCCKLRDGELSRFGPLLAEISSLRMGAAHTPNPVTAPASNGPNRGHGKDFSQ